MRKRIAEPSLFEQHKISRLGGIHPDLEAILTVEELADRLWHENLLSLKKLAHQFHVWPINDKPLTGDEDKIRKALVPVLASYFMTSHGFTQAQIHLSHQEYTRIFDDLTLTEDGN